MARPQRRKRSEVAEQVLLVPQDRIRPDKKQPRQHFDAQELEELADCMEIVGQLEPARTVRSLRDNCSPTSP